MARQMTKKQRKAESILRHGFALKRIFLEDPYTPDVGPVSLYKRLHRLEAEAHRAAERYSSDPVPEGYIERKEASVLKHLNAILGYKKAGVPVFVNLDPRGYALKIDDAWMRENQEKAQGLHTDWGGYGILAPDFD